MILPELWERLADDPDEPYTRRVLVDAMLAEGDPQGEYASIAMAPARADDGTSADLAAWEASLQTHAHTWLGHYAKVTQRAQFARGFPTRIELNAYPVAGEELEEMLADPRFATVEELVTGYAKAPLYAGILARAKHASLRRIEIKNLATLEAMEITTARLEHVAIPVWHDRGTIEELLATRILPACERFATLTSIAVPDDMRDTLFASRIFPRLRTITIGPDIPIGFAYWRALLPYQSLVIAAPRLPGAGRPHPSEIRVSRDADGVIARVTGSPMIDRLVNIVKALPKECTRLHVDGNIGWLTPITEACTQRSISFTHTSVITKPYGFVVFKDATQP